MARKSEVWKHFLLNEPVKGKATCKRCSATLQLCGNTSNFWAHLTSKHRISKASASDTSKSLDNDEVDDPDNPAPEPASSPTRPTSAEPSTSSSPASNLVSEPPKKKLKTFSINNAFKRQMFYGTGGEKNNAITEALLFMIVRDNLPFNFPEKEGFKNFMKVLAPLYKPISRSTVTRMVDSKYELISVQVKEVLEKQTDLSLTCDIWTDTQRTISYLGVTIQYLDLECMQIKSIMLEVVPLEDRHTAVNIASHLNLVTEKWNIQKKNISACATDNAASMKLAVEIFLGPGKHVACLAHSLNLVIPEAMKDIPELEMLKDKIKSIVTYFKRSVPAADALRLAQESKEGCVVLKLKQEVPTRFYSTLIMCERFVQLSDFIASILIKIPGGPVMLTATQLEIVQEVVNFLKHFKLATLEISAEKSVTLSKVIPLVSCLKKAVSAEKATTTCVKKLKENTLTALEKRFANVENDELSALSTIFDPRFKRMHFTDVRAHNSVISKASELIREKKVSAAADADLTSENSGAGENSLWSHHVNLLSTVTSQGPDAMDDVPIEFQQYLNQAPSELKGDPFAVWEKMKHVYPSIYPIAIKYLPVPGSSVPCERVFSKAGRLVNNDRNRLDKKRIGKLCFLSSVGVRYWLL